MIIFDVSVMCYFRPLAMIVGFTERSRTVSESLAVSSYHVEIEVASPGVSERFHGITIQHNEQLSTAVVESMFGGNTFSDARFGARDRSHDQLEDQVVLYPGETIRRVSASIVEDFRIEPEECFTLQLYFYETPGARAPLVTCNAGNSSTNFFCEHTVCIEDDDGMRFFAVIFLLSLTCILTEPFMVGFVQTTYTVLENAGSVEVCVQLTRPLTDILDETVRVSVVDHSSSVYIPAGAALASKISYRCIL